MLAVGPNGAGKTNLLEALHVGTQGVSPRTRVDAHLVRFGQSACRVRVEGTRDAGKASIDVLVQGNGQKQVRVNGSLVTSLERLRADSAALIFTPDRLAVVKAGPTVRRRYFDRVLTRVLPSRALLPSEYAAALAQRNAALRRVTAGLSAQDSIAPWTDRVVLAATALSAARREVLALLEPLFHERAGELGLEQAVLHYEESGITTALLEERLPQDLQRGSTGVGPHLDEIRILSAGRDLRSFGSQGEQRTAVLGLLLAEADLIATRRMPALLLLDDVLSELDGDRRVWLVQQLRSQGQVVITATSRSALPAEPEQVLAVAPGTAREV